MAFLSLFLDAKIRYAPLPTPQSPKHPEASGSIRAVPESSFPVAFIACPVSSRKSSFLVFIILQNKNEHSRKLKRANKNRAIAAESFITSGGSQESAMTFGYLFSTFDDFFPVLHQQHYSPWTSSPRCCPVHGRPSSFGGPQYRHRQRAMPKARHETADTPADFEPTPRRTRKVHFGKQNEWPVKAKEEPAEKEETLEGLDLENKPETTGRADEESRPEAEATSSHETADFENEPDESKEDESSGNETQDPEEILVEEKLNAIQIQLSIAKNLAPRVESFSGNTKERLYLEEHLTRCIINLDTIETNGSETVRTNRKAAIREIESLLNELDRLSI